jgi:hypothetical protein
MAKYHQSRQPGSPVTHDLLSVVLAGPASVVAVLVTHGFVMEKEKPKHLFNVRSIFGTEGSDHRC